MLSTRIKFQLIIHVDSSPMETEFNTYAVSNYYDEYDWISNGPLTPVDGGSVIDERILEAFAESDDESEASADKLQYVTTPPMKKKKICNTKDICQEPISIIHDSMFLQFPRHFGYKQIKRTTENPIEFFMQQKQSIDRDIIVFLSNRFSLKNDQNKSSLFYWKRILEWAINTFKIEANFDEIFPKRGRNKAVLIPLILLPLIICHPQLTSDNSPLVICNDINIQLIELSKGELERGLYSTTLKWFRKNFETVLQRFEAYSLRAWNSLVSDREIRERDRKVKSSIGLIFKKMTSRYTKILKSFVAIDTRRAKKKQKLLK